MGFQKPDYIKFDELVTSKMDFLWDDLNASDDFTFDSSDIIVSCNKLALTAKLSLGVGIYEWIYWRFAPYLNRKEPEEVLNLLWAGINNPNHFPYIEYERSEWLGPINGPIWCAMMHATSIVGYRKEGIEGVEEGLAYLLSLAVQVLPDSKTFLGWLNTCIIELEKRFPYLATDPFSNLFEESIDKVPIVSRAMLDPLNC